MNVGKFFQSKIDEQNYSENFRECIEKTCELCIESLTQHSASTSTIKPIMMLGKIQSGKTRAYTGLIALAFDNCFDLVIILTKNSVALVNQTYKRMRHEFHNEINNDEVEVLNIMTLFDGKITDYELSKKNNTNCQKTAR